MDRLLPGASSAPAPIQRPFVGLGKAPPDAALAGLGENATWPPCSGPLVTNTATNFHYFRAVASREEPDKPENTDATSNQCKGEILTTFGLIKQ
jgi:hypothetical protein